MKSIENRLILGHEEKSSMKGFSLIELIIVIVIIGILTAIAIPIFGNVQDNARQSAVEAAAANGSVTVQAALSTGRDPSVALGNSDTSEDIQLELLSADERSSDSVCVSAQWIDDLDIVSASGPGCDGWSYDEDTGSVIPPPVAPGDGGSNDDDESIGGVFRTSWDVDESRTHGLTVKLPLSGNARGEVNWGDGETSEIEGDFPSHTYDSADNYTIEIQGEFDYWGKDGEVRPDPNDIVTNAQEGLTGVSVWEEEVGVEKIAFTYATDLTTVAEPPVPLTDMTHMFWNAHSFNQPIGDWDTSQVTNMSSAFNRAYSFNQPLDNWDTSNATSMQWMFQHAHDFNQNLNSWDTINVTEMRSMFNRAESFNGQIGSWETGNVENMRWMFQHAHDFNQPINDWDVSQVTDMSSMFNVAESFNQDIGDWEPLNVTEMKWMFQANTFNQDISSWNVSSVEDYSHFSASNSVFEDAHKPRFGLYNQDGSFGNFFNDPGVEGDHWTTTGIQQADSNWVSKLPSDGSMGSSYEGSDTCSRPCQ